MNIVIALTIQVEHNHVFIFKPAYLSYKICQILVEILHLQNI